MATHRITVEVDDATARGLGALGDPGQVLGDLATSVAGVVSHRELAPREQTDTSLRRERDETDARLAKQHAADDETADEAVRVARARADQGDASGADRRPGANAARVEQAREELREQRAEQDEGVVRERSQARRHGAGLLATERESTDKHLSGERVDADSTLGDLREVNERMVGLTIRAQELSDDAGEARALAEGTARELRAVAEFHELFIGVLGHDLRSPLQAISMATGMLLRRGRLDEQDQRVVERIIRVSQRMGRMITQLLELTRARLGEGLLLETKPTDLRELCQHASDEVDARIELDLNGDLTGTWDADRLAEALSNLTANAVEHATPETPVVLEARADGDEVVLAVKNQGPPIPSEVLPILFEPFRRAKQNERSRSGHLGLGLYIARQILLAHGGSLEAQSAHGTTSFVMRLPRRPPPRRSAS